MPRNYDDFFDGLYDIMGQIPGAASFFNQEENVVWDEKLSEKEEADIIDVEFEDITDMTDGQTPSQPLLPVLIKTPKP